MMFSSGRCALDRALVEIVQRLPALLRVIAPVPRLQLEIAALARRSSPAAPWPPRSAAARAGVQTRCSRSSAARGRLRHRVGEPIVGESRVAEQARHFRAQSARSRSSRRRCRARPRSRRARRRRATPSRAGRAGPRIAGTARPRSASSVTTHLPGWPRSFAVCAAAGDETPPAGPESSSLSRTSRKAFSSPSTFCPNVAPSVASRSAISARRCFLSAGSPAPARLNASRQRSTSRRAPASRPRSLPAPHGPHRRAANSASSS